MLNQVARVKIGIFVRGDTDEQFVDLVDDVLVLRCACDVALLFIVVVDV